MSLDEFLKLMSWYNEDAWLMEKFLNIFYIIKKKKKLN